MIEVGFESDKGITRDHNEDSCLVLPAEQVYVVADGVGGNNSGEFASRMAVSCIAEFVREHSFRDAEDEIRLAELFRDCVKEVNTSIFQSAKQLPESRGMATTLVLCFVTNDRAYFVNVGDSRAYIKRSGTIFQVTEDHSYVNTLLKLGVINENEVKNHIRGNIITRALGAEANVQGDLYQVDLEEDDVVILCTDGLHGELGEDEIARTVDKADSMKELAGTLVEEANNKGGNDNITVICLKNRKGGTGE